jgi:hypothetical protein
MSTRPASWNFLRTHMAASAAPLVPVALPWQIESARKETSLASFSVVMMDLAFSRSLLHVSDAYAAALDRAMRIAVRATLSEKNMFFVGLSTINDYICNLA